ncbi:MAG: symmetrical bis(5'-nucleosyl)-tetraphosphatase [Oleibacter sp.]|nr:symmetrical bis(5'-nucleosyl)-tetraphosphatase [Thalassolituus sp.]
MATYAIGDLQGCFDELQQLLEVIAFDPQQDQLWFAGDLVNRGPKSLECLRFVQQLGNKAKIVLGNHDLHLLGVAFSDRQQKSSDTLNAILTAPDKDEILTWLRHQPLTHFDSANNVFMSHAGLPPCWTPQQAHALAQEVEQALKKDPQSFLQHMYGNQPDRWEDSLTGMDRLRVIVNYLTRMRFLDQDNRMNLSAKEAADTAPEGFKPWFLQSAKQDKSTQILFGHWAAIEGITGVDNVYALDTGCVWGRRLTALRLEDKQVFSVNSTVQ